MKYNTLTFLLLTALLSCQNQDSRIVGTWKVESKFYRATYEIKEEGGKLKGHLRGYDDDIWTCCSDQQQDVYLFQDLVQEKDVFVDATTGASKTTTDSDEPALKIRIQHKDTLVVTTSSEKKPLTEIWTRIK